MKPKNSDLGWELASPSSMVDLVVVSLGGKGDGGQESLLARVAQLEGENDELRRAVSLLHRVAGLVRESLQFEPTCYAVLTGVTAGVGLGLNRAMLFFVDEEDREILRGAAAVGPTDAAEADRVLKSIESDAPDLQTLYEAGLRQRNSPGPLDRRVRTVRVGITGQSPVALALRRAALVHAAGDDDLDGLLHLPTALAAPLRGRHKVHGVLYADNRFTGRALDDVSKLVFALVADHAGRAIDSARQYERVAAQARTDALTGLGHHGTMMQAVTEGVSQAQAAAASLGLAMLDLDDFKQVNDRQGHLAGDALLAAVAARLRGEVRVGETPFRYGGEEFAVLLPGVDPQALVTVGERLRSVIGCRPFVVNPGKQLTVTCSVGLALLEPGDDAENLIAAADSALLLAKAQGKNRVVLQGRN